MSTPFPSIRLVAFCLLVGAVPLPAQELPPEPTPPPTLDSEARRDLLDGATGIVAGAVVDGELDFLQAWGTPAVGATDSLEVTASLAFPGLTEILLGMTIRALGEGGLLDPTAPLSRYLPEMSGRLGRVTLDQLLSHTAGLANAPPAAGGSWDEALDALDDDAFIAEPGEVFSLSRYSYPLAARVLERIVGRSVSEVIGQAVLAPLGMERSTFDVETARAQGLATGYDPGSDQPVAVDPGTPSTGLPVLFTDARDVLQLLNAWMSGGIRGSSPLGAAPPAVPRLDVSRHFADGVTQDVSALVPQAWATRREVGFSTAIHMYPEARTGLFVWSNGPIPGRTVVRLRSLLAQAVGDVETSMASQGVQVRRRIDPSLQPDGLDDLGEWQGMYRNGSAVLALRFARDQLWYFDGERDLPLQGIGPATFAYSGEGGGPPLQLVRLGDRRIVLYGSMAYAWESAEVPQPGG